MVEKNKAINALQVIAACFIGMLVGYFAHSKYGRHDGGGEPTVQIDSTSVQVDTATTDSPEPSDVRPKDTVKIKVYIRVPVPSDSGTDDAAHVLDSVATPDVSYKDSIVYVPAVLQQKVYEDSTYRAVISGPAIAEYGPSLDSISVYRKTVTVYQTKTVYREPSPWGIGIQAGYGASKDGLTPYIGVGITYTLWSPRRGANRR